MYTEDCMRKKSELRVVVIEFFFKNKCFNVNKLKSFITTINNYHNRYNLTSKLLKSINLYCTALKKLP